MTVLPSKQDSTEHRLKWINRKALLAPTESIKIKILSICQNRENHKLNTAVFLYGVTLSRLILDILAGFFQ